MQHNWDNMSTKSISILVIFATSCLLLFNGNKAWAQTDSTQSALQDSTLEKQGEEGFNILQAEDSTRTADSLQQVQLLQQIADLRKRDARKKAELTARLDSIKNAQTQRAIRIKLQVDSLRAHTKGVPVTLDLDTLIMIYSKLGPFAPSERVASIQRKIEGIVSSGIFNPDDLTVHKGEESFDLIYQDQFILSITERDAFWVNDTPENVAKLYQATLIAGIEKYLKEHGLVQNAKRIGLLLIVLLLFLLIISYLNKAFTKVNQYFIAKFKYKIHSVRIKNYQLLSQEQAEYAIRWVLKMCKWLLIIVLLYISLPIVFSIFPTTEGIAQTLIGYATKPLIRYAKSFIQFLPNLFSIAIILLIARMLVKLLGYFSKEIELGKLKMTGFYEDWAKPTFNLLRILIYAFSFVMVFPYLPGSESPIFRGVSVFFWFANFFRVLLRYQQYYCRFGYYLYASV